MIIPRIITEIKRTGRLTSIAPAYDIPQNQVDMAAIPATRGYEYYGDVYIRLFDENNQLVDGNNALVTYQEYFDGIPAAPQQVAIPGDTYTIQTNILLSRTTDDTGSYYAYIVGEVIENNGTYTPPLVCDAHLLTVAIEQMAGAGNAPTGQVTVSATSSYGPIRYKLNNGEYQLSPTFNSLTGGVYTAYIIDAQGCTDSRTFTLETIANLLVSHPAADAGNGNLSRWSAAFNPVVFTYQRRDFSVSNIQPLPSAQKTTFIINGALSGGGISLAAGDKVYINAGTYNGIYDVESVNLTNSSITINVPFNNATNNTGFININKLRPYYQVKTKITYQYPLTNQTQAITCTHRPNNTGLVNADISSFLQSLLSAKDDSNFTQINYRDSNLSASYTISYAEVWQDIAIGQDTAENYVSIDKPYYALYAARQLGDAYGGNMATYVPFKTVDGPSRRARWITDFAEPAYSTGYPFDIGFIYSEDLAGLNLYAEITPLDINRRALGNSTETTYLLNENSSFLLNQDNSKLVIKRQQISNEPITQTIAQHIGLNRLLIDNDFGSQVRYFTLALKYADGGNTIRTVTQTQTIRIDDAVDDQSVYLRWIGLSGSWNYYRFVYNQEITLDVQNAVIIKNHIIDWAGQDAMEDVISKSAGMKMKVMAEDLSVADIKGLQSIKYSPKVQMLLNKNPVKWQTVVLNTATFAEYETRNGQAPFSVTFNLPALNIQTQ